MISDFVELLMDPDCNCKIWFSGRVLDSKSGSTGLSIVSLSNALYPLLSTGSTQEDMSQHG